MIVYLGGGLCNTMFQYAFGRSVSIARKEELFFDKSSLERTNRAYGLGAFNAQLIFANKNSATVQYSEPVFRYDSGVYSAPRNAYFCGCWQTEKYFDIPVVRKELSLRNPVSDKTARVIEEIQATPHSAFIHVRRGDYLFPVQKAYHGNMGMDYYEKAIEYIRERVPDVRFFVFSDDHDWCRQKFPELRIVDHIEGRHINPDPNDPGQEHEDLFMMSFCNHAIIPNSSFGWWGAWLGDTQSGRIVIGPKRWFLADVSFDDIMPERWIKL